MSNRTAGLLEDKEVKWMFEEVMKIAENLNEFLVSTAEDIE